MTDNNFAFNAIIGALDCVASAGARSEVIGILQRIRRTETKRCIGILEHSLDWISKHEPAVLQDATYDPVATVRRYLENARNEILVTSPGKGGG